MKNSFLWFSFSLLVLVMFAHANTCGGQTFRIDGPKTYNFTAATMNVSIVFRNNTATNYKNYAHKENDANGQIEFNPSIINMIDTNVSAGSEIIVNFIPRGPAAVNARIILFDSVATRDTIYINGQDPLYNDTANSFRLHVIKDLKEIPTGTSDSARFYYFDHGNSALEVSFYVINYTAAPISVANVFTGAHPGFSLVTDTSLSLGTYPSANRAGLVRVFYQPTKNNFDTAKLVFSTGAPHPKTDTLVLIARDKTVFSPSQLAGDTVDLGSFAPGSTDNNFMYTIRNRSPRMVTITDARESGDVNKSFTAPLGSLVNKVFMPGDTAYYFGTYIAPSGKEVSSEVLFTITYTTDRGETGFIYFKYTAITWPCYAQKPAGSLVMEPAIPGGYTKATFIVRNNDVRWVELKSITMGSGVHAEYFTMDTPITFPMYLDGWKQTEFTVRFTPKDSVVGDAYVPLTFEFGQNADLVCKTMNYELRSSTISPFDTSVIPLYPNQTASLPMASEKDTATKRFRFKNNLSIPVTVINAFVPDSGHFTITSTNPSVLPAVIEPNGMFTVDVLFTAADTGYYSDDLVIVTDHAISSETFHLTAVRMSQLPVAVNEPMLVTQYLHLTPNPAVSGVLCSAPVGTKKLSIYDALGTLIAQKENTSEWNWSAVHSDGTPATSGVYFVRAEGLTETRRPFVISKKLIIER